MRKKEGERVRALQGRSVWTDASRDFCDHLVEGVPKSRHQNRLTDKQLFLLLY